MKIIPGRELDAFIAECVMGGYAPNPNDMADVGEVWYWLDRRNGVLRGEPYKVGVMTRWDHQYRSWKPSTDITDAWHVVDAVHAMISNRASDGKRDDLNFLDLSVLGWNAGVAASFNVCNPAEWWEEADTLPFSARGATAAHAICLAALKVVKK